MSPGRTNGKICYLEVPATDVQSSAAFYESVFGWRMRTRGDGATAFDDSTGEVSGAFVLGRPPVGINGRLETTLPIGAGLSSSAALEVALGLALCSVADFAIEPLELAEAARRAEHRATGVPCGIRDDRHAACGLSHALRPAAFASCRTSAFASPASTSG